MRVRTPIRFGGKIRLLFIALTISGMVAAVCWTRTEKSVVAAAQDEPQVIHTVFSNPAGIAPADRVSNAAGTNPGIPPAAVYPSTINVSGLGTITKVTVTFAITSTFPDDFDILLVGPTGARSLVMSDAGGSGDPTNVSYTWDQTAAALMPDGPTTIVPTGTFRPSNYVGLAAPEPGGQDNFPAPAPGLMAYTADFNVFNGTNASGTWRLYVVDDQQIDTMSLPGGWSLDITATPQSNAKTVDFDGDGKTDPVVVRNTSGGSSGQLTWFILNSSNGSQTIQPWGLTSDQLLVRDVVVPEDYDGDGKTDIAVWRPGAPFNAYFYILQSATNTLRSDQFGQTGDDPSIVGDYDGDGKADPAVFREGTNPGDKSFWFYRASTGPLSGQIIYTQWGQFGDDVAPGDYDGDGKNDFCVQRSNGSGQGIFYLNMSTAGSQSVVYGLPNETLVPGDYDGDGKTDIATLRASGPLLQWNIRSSNDGSSASYIFGVLPTEDLAVQGDYDGDGKTDIAVWRADADPSQNFFYWRRSSDGVTAQVEWGQQGDYAAGNYNTH